MNYGLKRQNSGEKADAAKRMRLSSPGRAAISFNQLNQNSSEIRGAARRAGEMRGDLEETTTPRLDGPSDKSFYHNWLETTRDWLNSFAPLKNDSEYSTIEEGEEGEEGEGEEGEEGEEEIKSFTFDADKFVRRTSRKSKQTDYFKPPQPESKKRKKKSETKGNILKFSVSHGCSVITLNAVIFYLRGIDRWNTQANFHMLGEGARNVIYATSPIDGKNIRNIFEINGSPESQGKLVYGDKDKQRGWMALIESIKNSGSVRSHEVEHVLPATLKTLMCGGCPGNISAKRRKSAEATGGDSSHLFRYKQLEKMYLEVINSKIEEIHGSYSRLNGGEINQICIDSIRLGRLMDILFIQPEISSFNQFKCSLNLLKFEFMGRGFPEPQLIPDLGVIKQVVTRIVAGKDLYTRGDTIDEAHFGAYCGSKTFVSEGVGYEIDQPYGESKENLHTSGKTSITDEKMIEEAIDKLEKEITGNCKSICGIYNSIPGELRKACMAHSVLLGHLNYCLISADMIPGLYGFPDYNMPLVPLVRESIIYLANKGKIQTKLEIDHYIGEIEKLPFVDTTMSERHVKYIFEQIDGESVSGTVQGGGALTKELSQPTSPPSSPTNSPSDIPRDKDYTTEEDDGTLTPQKLYTRGSIDTAMENIEDTEGDDIRFYFSKFIDDITKLIEPLSEDDNINRDEILSAIFSGNAFIYQSEVEVDKASFKKKTNKQTKRGKKKNSRTRRRSVSSSSKKKKNKKRKKTKRKKKKSSRKIVIDISSLRESLS